MDMKEIIKSEQNLLRVEMQELKKCQLQYFITSVAGTSIIFGLLEKPTAGNELFFLSPLLILLPCWWTFFDKATTITRLVGYMTWLENQLSSPNPFYIGYETALQQFREREDFLMNSPPNKNSIENKPSADERVHPLQERPKQSMIEKVTEKYHQVKNHYFLRLLTLRTRHRYWMINWFTFFALSSVCCLLPLRFGLRLRPFAWNKLPWYLAIIAVVVSIIFTLRIVYHLTRGRYSYNKAQEFWKEHVFKDTWYKVEAQAAKGVP